MPKFRIKITDYHGKYLFERVSDNPAVWEALMELEQITNPRVRDEAGDITSRDRRPD